MADTVRILVADDSRSARASVVSILSAIPSVSITEAENGSQALKEACMGIYSLFVCDMEMPVMSGLQVLRILRAQQISSTTLPVILLTKNDDPSHKVHAFESGANDYVTKPVEPKELLARVRSQLDLRRLHREILANQALTLHAQKLAAVGQLSAAVAHELNTPAQYLSDNLSFLNSAFHDVLRLLQTSSGAPLPKGQNGEPLPPISALDAKYLCEEIPKSLQDMREGVMRVATIVQTIREFAESGSEHLTMVDVRRTVETVVELLRNRWLGVADVSTHYQAGLHTICCYPADVKHAVWQLLVEAADDLTVRANAAGPDAKRGQIEVSILQEEGHVYIKVRSDTVRSHRSDAPPNEALASDHQALRFVRAAIEEKHRGELTRHQGEDGWTTAVIKLPSLPPPA